MAFTVKRFTQLPLTLYRIQPRLPVVLRDFNAQMEKQRASFDLKTHNGLVLPAGEWEREREGEKERRG